MATLSVLFILLEALVTLSVPLTSLEALLQYGSFLPESVILRNF